MPGRSTFSRHAVSSTCEQTFTHTITRSFAVETQVLGCTEDSKIQEVKDQLYHLLDVSLAECSAAIGKRCAFGQRLRLMHAEAYIT